MLRSASALILVASLLAGCSSAPRLSPYSEPPAATPTASLRVITNGGARIAVPYQGCDSEKQILAIAGRRFEDGRPSINYPSIPAELPHLEMPARAAPPMPRLGSTIRKGEGDYGEVVVEYRVPAGVPLLLESGGAAASNGPSYFTCAPEGGVVQLQAGRSYELLTGMMKYQDELRCTFLIYELKPERPARLLPAKPKACPAP